MSMSIYYGVVGIDDMDDFLSNLPNEIEMFNGIMSLKGHPEGGIQFDSPDGFTVFAASKNDPSALIAYLKKKFDLFIWLTWFECDIYWDNVPTTLETLPNDIESFTKDLQYRNAIIRISAMHQHKLNIPFKQGEMPIFYDKYSKSAYDYFKKEVVPRYLPGGKVDQIKNAPSLTDSEVIEIIGKDCDENEIAHYRDGKHWQSLDCYSIEEWFDNHQNILEAL